LARATAAGNERKRDDGCGENEWMQYGPYARGEEPFGKDKRSETCRGEGSLSVRRGCEENRKIIPLTAKRLLRLYFGLVEVKRYLALGKKEGQRRVGRGRGTREGDGEL